jgi:hypothetical protein
MRNLHARLAKLEAVLLSSGDPEPAHHWLMDRLMRNVPAFESAKALVERLRIIAPVSIAQDAEAQSLSRDMLNAIHATQSQRSEH